MDAASPDKRKASPEQVAVLATLQQLDLPPEAWQELQQVITRYLAERLMDAADAATKDWTEADFERLLHEHLRTPYS